MSKLRPFMNILNKMFRQDWVLCSSLGYCFAINTYCGAKYINVEEINMPSEHTIFFDKFSKSYDLFALFTCNRNSEKY